jgi:hypothetical protein
MKPTNAGACFWVSIETQLEPFAQEVAREFGWSLEQLRAELFMGGTREVNRRVRERIDRVLRVANIIRMIKLGRDVERYFGKDDEFVKSAFAILGTPSREQQRANIAAQAAAVRKKFPAQSGGKEKS